MQWRYIHTGSRPPAENMAIDEAMLIAHSEGGTPPTVRFYGWNPPTLSIGYFQRAEREVDLQMVRGRGVGFVRRATGGRAVLHDQELTYSIIVSESYPGVPKSVTEAYRVLSSGLLHGFRKLGLDAVMVGLAKTDGDSAGIPADVSSACFDSPSRYELVVEGRKIAGSAQMRSKGVILQHGSVLLDVDTDLLFDLLRFSSVRAKDRMKQSFKEKAAAINTCLAEKGKPPITIKDAEEAFRDGFAEGLDAELAEDEMTGYEQGLAQRLLEQKYSTDDWNFRR
ncbi:biotin/lipoate A/B protein ligase family protein [Paenibacillus sp. sptzw28]|uniref:lipoate--protein ligase family protein n=1 Tax=Paenibacillus sp. sptzw28 TaxID=715179 RepID=UPI002868D1BF|nr:biotin/lipoate A/B protein ligase family protein [Paenibacillus sp. sptzw28]